MSRYFISYVKKECESSRFDFYSEIINEYPLTWYRQKQHEYKEDFYNGEYTLLWWKELKAEEIDGLSEIDQLKKYTWNVN